MPRPFVHDEEREPLNPITTTEWWLTRSGKPLLYTQAAWASANQAVYVPIQVRGRVDIDHIGWLVGTTQSGNYDLGIYAPDSEGKPGTRLFSTGSTANPSFVNPDFTFALLSTSLRLVRGLYYLALAISNTTQTVMRSVAGTTVGNAQIMGGVFTQASALPLPATATPSASFVACAVPILACGQESF